MTDMRNLDETNFLAIKIYLLDEFFILVVVFIIIIIIIIIIWRLRAR